jgi:outer membrane receptor protein involved in Fe transport
LATAVLLASTYPAAAQTVPAETDPASSSGQPNTEEIVVTARKRTESLEKIPESIVAISAQAIADAHVTQVDDLAGLVSNLNIVQRNDNTPDVTLRGVGSFGVVQGVGFYANDVQLFEGQTIRPEDLERIEVLKGPQGTLFGGANIGGAIKYVTKMPTDTWEGEVTTEGGDPSTANLSGVISGPLTDRVQIRLSAYGDTNGGYIYDPTLHNTLGTTRDLGGRLTLTYDDSSTSVRFYLNADKFNTSGQNLLYRPSSDHDYQDVVYDYVSPYFKRRLYAPTVQIEQHLTDDVSLTSISSYFHSFNKGQTDLCKCNYPFDALNQNFANQSISQELRLQSTDNSPFSWMVGLYGLYHRTQSLQLDNYAPFALTFDPADKGNATVVDNALDVQSKHQHEYAAFANAQYRLDDWTFELGLRGEYYDSHLDDLNTPSFHPFAFVSQSGKVDGREVSPKVSVSYQFDPNAMAYGTLAKGFEPADEVFETVVHPYKAEEALSYEVGVKSRIFDSIHLNAAAFYIDYTQRLFQTIQFTNAGIFEVTNNIGASKNYGFEFDVSSRLPWGFSANASFGVTEAVWDSIDFFDPVAGMRVNLKGRTAPFTPEYQGNVEIDWTHPLTADWTFVARADTSFFGTSYWDPQDYAKQRPYDLLNLGMRVESEDWTAAWRMTNVLNTRYNTIYDAAADVGAPFNVAHLARPREWVFTLTRRF